MKTSSLKETKAIAARLAQEIVTYAAPQKSLVLALTGNLGSGKTTFTQGLLKALGVQNHVTSPTFVLLKRYTTSPQKSYTLPTPYTHVYHMDCYRLANSNELHELDFNNIVKNPKNIIVIEWPEKIKESLPSHTIWISFAHGKKEDERVITLR